jgi:hypothetical protein
VDSSGILGNRLFIGRWVFYNLLLRIDLMFHGIFKDVCEIMAAIPDSRIAKVHR